MDVSANTQSATYLALLESGGRPILASLPLGLVLTHCSACFCVQACEWVYEGKGVYVPVVEVKLSLNQILQGITPTLYHHNMELLTQQA